MFESKENKKYCNKNLGFILVQFALITLTDKTLNFNSLINSDLSKFYFGEITQIIPQNDNLLLC